MTAPLVLVDAGFREEDGILVYRSTEELRATHSADWFFDELARRDPARVLVDVRRVGPARDTSRSVVYRRHGELAGRKIAILGSSRVQEFVITFLMAATGNRSARFFTDEDAARAWLREAA